ncbi:MAG: hypothetical protein IPG99_15110 [Ignavibacteria bacterium]|nr:hypothetical protein [Ignavibacteria bacterium]
MTNPHEFGKAEGSKTSYYGYGWYVRMRNNRLQPSQGGTMTGTKSILAKLQDSNGNVLNASLIFNKYDGLEETVPKYDWNLFDKVVEMSEKINSCSQDDYWENFF